MEIVYLVVLLALVEYSVLGGMVGHARGKYGIRAPATTGHDGFERTFRVHQNTLEALIVFLPAIVLFGRFVSAGLAATLGLIWIVGRAVYAWGYIAAAEKRGMGAGIGGIVQIVLVFGSLFGVIRAML